MRHMRRHLLHCAVLIGLSVGLGSAARPFAWAFRQAAPATTQLKAAPGPETWEAAIKKFEDADNVSPPPSRGVVFVGSSSIVRWNLKDAFPELGAAAINRGFGGSVIQDAVYYADRIVIPYKPRLVVLYSGDNDLTTPETPKEIADRFIAFVEKVHTALPQSRTIVISIKPSLQRWAFVDKARAANALVRAHCATHPYATYLDVEPLMLGADGKPKPELFVADGLHMTPEGYKIWNAAIGPLLK